MNPRRALIALLLVNVLIQTGSAVSKGQVPRPSRFVAIGLLFTVLSVVGEFGPSAQRIAVGFGALVTLGVGLGKLTSIQKWKVGTAPQEYDAYELRIAEGATGGGGPLTGNTKGKGKGKSKGGGGGSGGAW